MTSSKVDVKIRWIMTDEHVGVKIMLRLLLTLCPVEAIPDLAFQLGNGIPPTGLFTVKLSP
jgi:hypothetical protein